MKRAAERLVGVLPWVIALLLATVVGLGLAGYKHLAASDVLTGAATSSLRVDIDANTARVKDLEKDNADLRRDNEQLEDRLATLPGVRFIPVPGAQGNRGPRGKIGKTGPSGTDGQPGRNGNDGAPGADSTVPGPPGRGIERVDCTAGRFVIVYDDGTEQPVEGSSCTLIPMPLEEAP